MLPPGSVWIRSLIRWRSRRFTRFRVTAGPTDLATTKPTFAGLLVALSTFGTTRCVTTRDPPDRRPRRTVCRKSSAAVRRLLEDSTSGRRPQTARLLRPLRRRADRIARPARVRIRRRKPCTLCRRRLFGWYVRLLTNISTQLLGRVHHRVARRRTSPESRAAPGAAAGTTGTACPRNRP